MLLLASVSLWKKHNPQDNLVLYCDKLTHKLLKDLEVTSLWNDILEYNHTRPINRSVFWAASKVQVLSEQTEPVIIMDNDTLVFQPIKHLLNPDTVYVSNFEIGKGYYPNTIDPYVQKLSYRSRWKTESVNVSFLYLPDPAFTQMYAKLSLNMMEEFTVMNVPHSQYLIFAEQLLLKHLVDREKIKCRSIISTYWDCNSWKWGEDNELGFWPIDKSGSYFNHYGPLKSWIIKDEGDNSYKKEMKMLFNCVNIPTLDLSIIHKK